ncbi:uncharacterized protein LOC117483209 [Trematomus bernacchii]|uniref:uncharacterized protein LOC117483209 n=1 Tax=Trematomus bernacchii TaxID=40690 RepID=UPI00146F2590|nr:uncharacterized protein LOC117483209 [Trematomus bernacchii]
MRSGYHYIRGGDCSKFQHSSYVGTLLSPHDIKGTPVSVVPPENGIKNNMVAIQLPGPAQLQQGYAHSKQHFKGLHCHPKSQSSILDCGFQPPIPGDSACYSQGSRNQISRDGNGHLFSSTRVSKSVYNTSYQQQVCSRSLSREKVLPVGELEPPTDDEILDFVAKRVRYFGSLTKYVPSKKLCNRDSPLQSDPISPKVDCFSHLPKTSASDRKYMGRQTLSNAVNEECTAAVGPALEEDSSKDSKSFAVLLPKSKGIDDCSASASEKHSKEHPRKMKKVPATCTREKDGRPVVAAAVPEMTCEEMTEKQSSLIFNGSPSEEQKSFSLNIKTYFGDKSQLPGVTSVLSENKTFGQASLIENQQCTTLYSPVDTLTIHNVWSIPTNQSEGHSSQTSYEGPRKDAGSTRLQTDTENKEFYFPTASEDIMKDESPHIDDMTAETSSTTPDPNDKQSSFENEGAGLKDDVTDDYEGDYEDDDDEDDDMLFIPLTISDVKFEHQDQESQEKDGLDGGETEDQERQCDPNPNHYPSPKPLLAMKEFDTIESFLQAVNSKKIQMELVELIMDSEEEGHTPHNRRVSSDSCKTDDSCDYPLESDNKCLPLSRSLFGKKTDASVPEGKANEVTNVQQGHTRSLEGSGCMQICTSTTEEEDCSKAPTNGQNISNNNDIIIIQSDSEDDVEQNYQKKPKRKKLFTSSSEDSDSSTCNRPKTHLSKTVGSRCETSEENSTKKRRISADSPIRQSKCHDAPFEEGMQNACSDLLHSEEMNGQLGGSTESVIVIDSDTEDDDQNKEPSGNTFICSGSDDGDRRCVEQKRQSPLTVKSGNGSAKDIRREARQSSPDLSQSLNQSMLHDAPQKTNRHDSDSDSDVINKIHCHKRRVKFKRIVSSESEESDDETVDSLCGAANEKSKKNSLSSKDPKVKKPQSLNKKANSTSGSKSVIPRSVVEKPNRHHKLFKESNNDRQVKDGTPKTSTASSKKTDSVDKNTLDLPKPKRANDGPHTTKHNVQANVKKPTIFSRQHSLPGQKCTSTSVRKKPSKARRSSAGSRDLTPSGETPASSNHPASKQSIYTPRQSLSTSKLRCSVSCGNRSTMNHPVNPTKCPSPTSATMETSARKRLTKEMEVFIPIGNELNKKLKETKSTLGMEDDVTTGTLPSRHNRAPIQRQNSKSATPLMKRTKFDAVQLTKARIRDTPKEQGNYDCEGYKWSEKPTVTKPIQGLSRKKKL